MLQIPSAMIKLGLFLGKNIKKPSDPKRPHYFEDDYLGKICRDSYVEPWLDEKRPQIDRVAHLRRWAGLQCKKLPKETAIVCGKHPILSLMGADIIEAWKEPKFICVERSIEDSYQSMQKVHWCWHPSTARYSFDLLKKSREELFEKYQPPLLRIMYDVMKTDPERTILELCTFLNHTPTPKQHEDALTLIKTTEDDCCFF